MIWVIEGTFKNYLFSWGLFDQLRTKSNFTQKRHWRRERHSAHAYLKQEQWVDFQELPLLLRCHTRTVKDRETHLIQALWIFLSICSNIKVLSVLPLLSAPFSFPSASASERLFVPWRGCASGGHSSSAFARSDLAQGGIRTIQGGLLEKKKKKRFKTSWVTCFTRMLLLDFSAFSAFSLSVHFRNDLHWLRSRLHAKMWAIINCSSWSAEVQVVL